MLKEYQAVQNESIRKERIILSDMQKKLGKLGASRLNRKRWLIHNHNGGLDEDEKKASGREAGDPYQFSLDEMVTWLLFAFLRLSLTFSFFSGGGANRKDKSRGA